MYDDLRKLLTGELLQRVYEDARHEYPRECCGMIHRSGRLRICHNAQDRFHESDPIRFPRTGLNGFIFEFGDQLFLAQSLEGDDPIRIVYHSHPDGRAEFSHADLAAALCEGDPVYPEIAHLIIALAANGPCSGVLFGFENKRLRRFFDLPAAGTATANKERR